MRFYPIWKFFEINHQGNTASIKAISHLFTSPTEIDKMLLLLLLSFLTSCFAQITDWTRAILRFNRITEGPVVFNILVHGRKAFTIDREVPSTTGQYYDFEFHLIVFKFYSANTHVAVELI